MSRAVLAPGRVELPYTEIAPPADLAPYVDRFWMRTTLRGDPARRYRVLPDGCVDVIVHGELGTAHVVGAMTRALELPVTAVDMVAVRFRPGTAAAIVRCSLAELTDRRIATAELSIASGPLVEQIVRAGSLDARVRALTDWVRARLASTRAPDRLVARAVALLSGAGADPRVDRVAGELGVTRQHLARRFRREVGITPKELARIARLQRATAALGSGGVDVARLAVELGYFDQSHLAHDVRELIGVTPAALAAERPIALSHLFGTRVPFLQSSPREAP